MSYINVLLEANVLQSDEKFILFEHFIKVKKYKTMAKGSNYPNENVFNKKKYIEYYVNLLGL